MKSEYRVTLGEPQDRDLCEEIERLKEVVQRASAALTRAERSVLQLEDALRRSGKRALELQNRVWALEDEIADYEEGHLEPEPELSVQEETGERGRL